VERRITEVLSRAGKSVPPVHPRRGFVALVEALAQAPAVTGVLSAGGDQPARAIAALIGAAPDDLVVRNLLARLRAVLGKAPPPAG
jgi:phosphoserine phosphatase